MRRFFREFKEFISKGSVIDMAVGIIIGGAFTAIVTALTNNILMPIINWVLGGNDGLEGAYTYLSKVETVNENGEKVIDLAKSIYIDWGSFITAIINFILIAFVLFIIIKTINGAKTKMEALKEKVEEKKEEK